MLRSAWPAHGKHVASTWPARGQHVVGTWSARGQHSWHYNLVTQLGFGASVIARALFPPPLVFRLLLVLVLVLVLQLLLVSTTPTRLLFPVGHLGSTTPAPHCLD